MAIVHTLFTTTKEMSVEYAHRLLDYKDPISGEKGLCANIHGHSGIIKCTFGSDKLHGGMVLDFKIMKHVLNELVIETFDHALILQDSDPLVDILKDQKLKMVVIDDIPTAEYLAIVTLTIINDYLIQQWYNSSAATKPDITKDDLLENMDVICTEIEWYETSTSKATVHLCDEMLEATIDKVMQPKEKMN